MHKLDIIDSTNNYAMQCIDADKAEHGMLILAKAQSAGKGQRGHSWKDNPGESLLMSLIIKPLVSLQQQTRFMASIAVAVASQVQIALPGTTVQIKWPNDIIVGDKKAGGILIENVVRGFSWEWSVVGIGLNIAQTSFREDLPNASSLYLAGAEMIDIDNLAIGIRNAILEALLMDGDSLIRYNERLFRKHEYQKFRMEGHIFEGRIQEMDQAGSLKMDFEDGRIESFQHGQIEWVWGD